MLQSIRIRASFVACATLVGIGLTLTCFVGCKSRTEQSSVSQTEDASRFIQDSLIGKIPHGSIGFYYWSLKSPSYRRLESSPWKTTGSSAFDPSSASSAFASSPTSSVFKDAGLDLMDPKELEKTVDELVVYIVPSLQPTADNPVDFGALLTPRAGANFEEKFEGIKTFLENQNAKVTTTTFSGAKGFEAELPVENAAGNAADRRIVIAYSDSYASLGTSSGTVQITAENLQKGGSIPAIVNEPSFAKLTRSFNRAENRYALGYIDIEKFAAIMSKLDPSSKLWSTVPARAAAVESWMAETPGTNASLALWPRNEEQEKLIAAINSPVSPMLVSSLPASPMLYLSIDGGVIAFIKGAVGEENLQGTAAELLNDVSRLVIAVKPAPIGQAALPIPEILLGLESSNPEKLALSLVELSSSMMPPSGGQMPSLPDRTVGAATVRQIPTPLGSVISVASVANLVLLSTTEQQINSSLENVAKRANQFVGALAAPQRDLLVSRPTAGALYVDFPQLAGFLESIGSLMGMYGASDSGVTNPEQLEAMKTQGRLVGVARLADEVLEINSFYTASPK